MSMAGSNPQAEALSEAAQKAFQAKDYAQAVERYRAAAQIVPTCATHLRGALARSRRAPAQPPGGGRIA